MSWKNELGGQRPVLPPLGRLAMPLVAGAVVFGVVTAFAATLPVSSTTVGAGNGTVGSCNVSASVTYTTVYAPTLPGYKVATAPVATAASCAGLAYKLTLTGAGNASLGEATGTLNASGGSTPDFTASNIAAALVTGVSVVITG